MTELWRVKNEATDEFEENIVDIRCTQAVNRFAQTAKVDIVDYDGIKHQEYTKGTPVSIDVVTGTEPLDFEPLDLTSPNYIDLTSPNYIDLTFDVTDLFGGFVIDVEREDDVTSIKILSYDFWLRRRDVLRSYEDEKISNILEDLITTLTPLDWDSGFIDVLNDRTISRKWKGENLSEVIDELASISGQENFGATANGTFFFRPRDSQSAPFDLSESRFTKTKWDEEGRHDVNQVTVYFGEDDATGAVTVADRQQQKELADRLDRPRPVVIETSKSYPEITFDPEDPESKEEAEEIARRKGRKIVQGRTGILKGEVKSWSGFDVDAGDIIFVQDTDKDISGEFRIAEIEYNYSSGDTIFRLAENKEGVIDILVEMSEEVTRIDLRDADEDVVPTEYVAINNQPAFETKVKAFKITLPEEQFLWGERLGGWGHPDIGGGRWGDNRDDPEEIDMDLDVIL